MTLSPAIPTNFMRMKFPIPAITKRVVSQEALARGKSPLDARSMTAPKAVGIDSVAYE